MSPTLAPLEPHAAASPTFKGWLLGLLSCAGLALAIPYVDNCVRCTQLAMNPLPAFSVVIVFLLVLGFNLALARVRESWGLARADLVLIFSMTMVVNALPGAGFLNYLANIQMGFSYYATPENRMSQAVRPYIPVGWAPYDSWEADPVVAVFERDVGGSFNPVGGAREEGALTGAEAVREARVPAGERVLLRGQDRPALNGLYVVTDPISGTLERTVASAGQPALGLGLYVRVLGVQDPARRFYRLTNKDPIAVNETPVNFAPVASEHELTRPVEWFYSGLPYPEQVPWRDLAGPYARWCLALVFILGSFFAVSALLYPQWATRENLPFPLTQIPSYLIGGPRDGTAGKPAWAHRLFWWGAGLVFLFHSWNALRDYIPGWVSIQHGWDFSWYMTEPPWRALRPFTCLITPSVVALLFLISLEVSFSLWFFYIVLFKLGVVIAVTWFGLGEDGWYFVAPWSTRGLFINQGTGALLAMVLAGGFMARKALWQSLRQAAGLEAAAREPADLSPRLLWLLLLACLAGAVAWLSASGVYWPYALLVVSLLLLISIGVTRLVAETGVLWTQAAASPASMVEAVLTPAHIGAGDFVRLNLFSRVFSFDWFRVTPMIGIVSSLHLAAQTRTRLRPLLGGLAAALLVTAALSFVSFYHTAYTSPAGAGTFGFGFTTWPYYFYRDMAANSSTIARYQEASAAAEAEGRTVPESDRPNMARPEYPRLIWMGVGAGVMALFMFLRTRFFWWPHAVGYVVWMQPNMLSLLWFSFFLGWFIKWAVLKFGGQKLYLAWRGFFIGILVGEAAAALVWIAVALATGTTDGYQVQGVR